MKSLIPWKRKNEQTALAAHEDHPFDLLQRRMNELFDDFFEDVRMPVPRRGAGRGLDGWPGGSSPRFEVSETDEAVRVKAELPGLDEKDLDVEINGDLLTIRGEKKSERAEKKRDYHLSELSYGRFVRSVALPEGIDRDKVKATFEKGVLNLDIPKTEAARAKSKRIALSSDL